MGRTGVALCLLLAAGCQKVFDVREVGEGDAGMSGIQLDKAYSAQTAAGELPTALVTFQQPPAQHDLIVVFVAFWHNVPAMVTDTTNQNSYVLLPTTVLSPGGSNLWMYYAYDVVTAPQFAITVTSTPASGPDLGKDELAVIAHDYSGTGTGDGLDGQNSAEGDPSSGATVTSDCGEISASQPDVMVAALTRDFNGAPTVSTGWKLRGSLDGQHATSMVLATADRIAGPETADPVFVSPHMADGYSWACLTASFH